MKKLVLMLALAMAMLCSTALSEEATIVTFDMGDFTIDLPEDICGEAYEKVNGAMRLMVMPDDQEESYDNLNLIWMEGYVDMREIDIDEITSTSIPSIRAQIEAEGVDVGEIDVIDSGSMKQDGVRGVYFVMKSDYGFKYDGEREDMTLYSKTCIFSDEYLGTYTFTLSARSMESIDAMQEMLNTIRWN